MCWVWATVPPPCDRRIRRLQRLKDLWQPRDAHEEDERPAALVARQSDFFALATDASADDEGLGGATLGDRYAGKCRACEDGADTRDDDGLESVRPEVEDFLASTAIDRGITLFKLKKYSDACEKCNINKRTRTTVSPRFAASVAASISSF